MRLKTADLFSGCGGFSEGLKEAKGFSTEYAVDFLPKTKLEVAVSDDQVDSVVEAISKAAHSGKIGDGKIFVSGLEQVIRIRTGESGDDAL